MYTVSIMDAPLGSILAEPVYYKGTLLINQGVCLSNNLRHALMRFGIFNVSVEGVFSEHIDESKLKFGSLDNLTYIAIRNLDVDKIIICARTMIEALRDGNPLMTLMSVYDTGTMQHSINVASLALTLGIAIGMSLKELENLAIGALLHDVGKMRVPTSILNKTGKLDEDELAIMRKHPEEGYDIIKTTMSSLGAPIKQIVYQHHEDFDGTGYPRGLSDFHIYRSARIVHICDVYDALCSKRSYKESFPKELVWEIMDSYCGTKFDPILYKKFKKVIPYYSLGEEIVIGDYVGVVVKEYENNPQYPDVYFNGTIMNWSELSKMNEEKINRLRGSEGVLQIEKYL